MNTKCMFSSAKDNWQTPKNIFNELNKKYNFTVDLCADNENKLCKIYYTEENSCLNKNIIGENIFCNPPYGRQIGKFIKKCYELAKNNTVVGLLPARTDTKWFHDYIYKKAEIEFIKGRLHFEDNKNPAPFPSMIVIFKNKE